MFIVLLLFSGIDMIGDMPSRVIPVEDIVVESAPEVVIPEPVTCTSPKPKKTKTAKKKKEPKIVQSQPEQTMIPFPEEDKLEPGEKEVEAIDDSEAGYKFYVYRSHGCQPCIWLVNELQKNVDEKDLILSYERTTKSGKRVTYVPVLEVYKDGKLVHQQVGYTSWKTIQGKLGEID